MDHGQGPGHDSANNDVPENTELKVLIVDDSSFDCTNIIRQCRQTSLPLSMYKASALDKMCKALD